MRRVFLGAPFFALAKSFIKRDNIGMEKFEVLVTDVSFRNDENGFTVLQVRLDNGVRTSAVGVMPAVAAGERAVLTGEWTEHTQYGKQIRAVMCEPVKPTTVSGVERYLGSGLIKGIGPSTAKTIVEYFGAEALDILQYAPERLTEIPGIGKKRAAMMAESFASQSQMREAMVMLQSFELSPAMAMKIFNYYKESTQEVLRRTPYRLVEDIDGLGFRTADRIAAAQGMSPGDPARLRAGMHYILSDAAASGGHTYLPREILIAQAARLLSAPAEAVETALEAAVLSHNLVAREVDDHVAVYMPRAFQAESETARRLLELLEALPYRPDPALAGRIAKWERENGKTLNADQKKAVRAAVCEGVSVITGGPGTGKTTILRCVLSLLDADDEIVLAAPTGRAAKRMSEATGAEARTIHRLLEYGGGDGTFARDESNPIEADVVIVDEMSMVDIFLMRSLLRALIPGTRLILVGDADQLPSVGAGNVLRDILESDAMPVVWLKEIYRQDGESMIVLNAHRINAGEMPVTNSKGTDFFLERCETGAQAAQRIVDLARRRLPVYAGVDPLKDIQVLSPTKKGECGVFALNTALQNCFNPPKKNGEEVVFGDTAFRAGDKVMQTRNDYNMEWRKPRPGGGWEEGQGVFNGNMGFVEEVSREDREVLVHFDDEREARYDAASLEDLELAYCVSVHKSQGSEFPVVVMPAVGGPPMLLTRNLFYTAVTRAKRMVVLVGRDACVSQMVQNVNIARRYSALKQWLRQAP